MDGGLLQVEEGGPSHLELSSGAPLLNGMAANSPLPAPSPPCSDAHNMFDTSPVRESAIRRPVTWADLIRDNSNITYGAKLMHIPPSNGVVSLEDSDRLDLETKWGFSIVGKFAGRFPGLGPLRAMCEQRFQVPFELFPDVNGWILFKFSSEDARQKVLHGGPYSVFGRTLLMKPLTHDFDFVKERFTVVPVWTRLFGLPLAYWSPSSLSKLASCIGKPISTDKLTNSMARLSYARVLVDVDITKPPPSSIAVRISSEVEIEVRLEYEAFPRYCTKCLCIGHICDSEPGSEPPPAPKPRRSRAQSKPRKLANMTRTPAHTHLDKGKGLAPETVEGGLRPNHTYIPTPGQQDSCSQGELLDKGPAHAEPRLTVPYPSDPCPSVSAPLDSCLPACSQDPCPLVPCMDPAGGTTLMRLGSDSLPTEVIVQTEESGDTIDQGEDFTPVGPKGKPLKKSARGKGLPRRGIIREGRGRGRGRRASTSTLP